MKRSASAGTSLLSALALLFCALPASAQRSPGLAAAHIDAAVLNLACAPAAATALPTATLRITGGQDTQVRVTFAQGDFVTLNGGRNQGIQVGQEFFVRRLLAPRGFPVSPQHPGTTRTAGWIRVYAVDDDLALATITFACDVMEIDDYLEPLALPTPVKIEPRKGKPERVYARVVLGNDGRTEFGARDHFVIDSGAAQGVAPGTQFVVYRWKKRAPDNFLAAIAEAVAVDVQDGTATLSVTSARDSVSVNDLVAMRKGE